MVRFVTVALFLVVTISPAAAPAIFQTGSGRFEIVSTDAMAARAATAEAEAAWQFLAVPLGLPDGFSSPVFVRLFPAKEWSDPTPFRVVVEAGGVVSVRMGWSAATPVGIVRRALVQGLLMRLAIDQQGVNERLTAPLWLEHAAVTWWENHADGAQLDAFKQSATAM